MKTQFNFKGRSIDFSEIDWHWIRDRIIAPYIIGPITRLHPNWPGYDEAIQVMDEDWDTLIILDACRSDIFEETIETSLFDTYEKKVSLGSHSSEWVRRNFHGKSYGDTVYISANPHTNLLAHDVFHDIIELWNTDYDDELGTVHPKRVAEAAKDIAQEYPNKRLIVHFMQPHGPLIGASKSRPFDSDEAYWQAYRETLEFAFPYAQSAANEIDGKAVITADHGQINKDGIFKHLGLKSHKPNLRIPGLVEVPWAVIDDKRREVKTGKTQTGIQNNVDDRLRDLGYKI